MTTVLLQSVGLSAAPLAMAALTLRPDVIVLVHSVTSVTTADRLHAIVTEHVVDDDWHPRWQRFGVTDAATEDFVGLRLELAPLAELLRVIPEAIVHLDYSGGTQVLVSELVRMHFGLYGRDRRALRTSVGTDDHYLHFDDGTSVPLYDRLSIAERVKLAGYSSTVSGALADEQSPDWQAIFEAEPFNADQALTAIGMRCLSSDRNRYLQNAGTPGSQNELIVAASVIQAIRFVLGDEVDAGRVECLWSVEIFGRLGGLPLCELDVIARVGNAILSIEVKTKASTDKEPAVVLATRVHWIRAAFGEGATVAFWSADGQVRKELEDIKDLVDERLLPFSVDRIAAIKDAFEYAPEAARPAAGILVRKFLLRDPFPIQSVTGRPICGTPILTAALLPTTNGDVIPAPELPLKALAAFGGSRLALHSAAINDGLSSLVVIGPPTDTLKRQLKSEKMEYHYVRHYKASDAAGVSATFRERTQSVKANAYYVTPSTKATTAALTILAVIDGVELIHADLETGRLVRASGGELPRSRSGVHWTKVLPRYGDVRTERSPQPEEVKLAIHLVQRVVDETSWVTKPILLTLRSNEKQPSRSSKWHPTAVLGGHHTAIAVWLLSSAGGGPTLPRMTCREVVTNEIFGPAARIIFLLQPSDAAKASAGGEILSVVTRFFDRTADPRRIAFLVLDSDEVTGYLWAGRDVPPSRVSFDEIRRWAGDYLHIGDVAATEETS